MEKIYILDFGGQYTHLEARRIRQLHVFSEIVPADTSSDKLKDASGIILSGGPQNISESDALKCDPKIFELGVPVLGLCYGHQLMAHLLGGEVKQGKTKEYGTAELDIKDDNSIFKELEGSETVWMSHGDTVSKLPEGFKVIGSTSDCENAAVANEERKLYGFQFHPEVTHTFNGLKMLENFVDICGCKKDWTMHSYMNKIIEEIKQKTGDKKVFLLVSGGVDSTVLFALLDKALGTERVYGLHIDNAFVRKNETKIVEDALKKIGFNNFHVLDASEEFLEALEEIYDPEEKRKIIGNKFVEIVNREIKNLNLNPEEWLIGQGTIYPDTIETQGTQYADLIKTHHNRVEMMRKLVEQGKVIEPLAQLYKDEVREVGTELGLPKEIIWKHPFPGPGLAVRCLCAKEEDRIENEEEVKKKVSEITSKYGFEFKLLPIKSVGVQGDARTYKHPVVLMGKANWGSLEKVSTEITNNVKEINRVIYLIKPDELEEPYVLEGYLTKKRLDLLRDADHISMNCLEEREIMDLVWQMPTVLIPISLKGGESVVLRPVFSTEAMTAQFARLPLGSVQYIADKIFELKGIDAVFYDVTHKPPGTIEWE